MLKAASLLGNSVTECTPIFMSDVRPQRVVCVCVCERERERVIVSLGASFYFYILFKIVLIFQRGTVSWEENSNGRVGN